MTPVSICNLALHNIGTRSSIAALNEDSAEARACNSVYEFARDDLLREYDWHFARRRVVLEDLGSPPVDWSYKFRLPSDCLRARRFADDRKTMRPFPFELAVDVDGEGIPTRVVYANLETPTLVYTCRIVDTSIFDTHFARALAWLVAADISLTLTGSVKTRDAAVRGLVDQINRAKAATANEDKAGDEARQEHLPDWLRIRGFGMPDIEAGNAA